ncbi:MAG: cupin domain-containing protein [Microbacterium sp.]|uniref:cupin domain-containing protein n=1 Tax=Microbacterium sp. TaxID=51671 RepID=UPI00261BFF04|nr:cupin domain-containing protein [Microbacterium sp.]MCX6501460.1 cupin domain-containing protein [Microbacterium sp.]
MNRFDHPFVPRRVVTGTVDGASTFLSDGPAENTYRYASVPGMTASVLYATASPATLPVGGDEIAPITRPTLPKPGETVVMIVTFPPDTVYFSPDFDPVRSAREQHDFYPEFAASFDPDAPGVHQTASVDYDIVLDGEIWLELDSGTRRLSAGDVVIQGGARHAWRNAGDTTATMCFVLIGAEPARAD